MIIYTSLVAPEHLPLRHGVLEKVFSSALLALLPRVDYVAPHVLYGIQVTRFAWPVQEFDVSLLLKPCADNSCSVDGRVILQKINK